MLDQIVRGNFQHITRKFKSWTRLFAFLIVQMGDVLVV